MDIFKRKKKKQDEELLKRNHDEIARALEILFAVDYIDKKKLYFHNFLRGMVFSAGGVIGATLVIAVLIWILSVFDNIPVIGPVFEDTKNSIQKNSNNN